MSLEQTLQNIVENRIPPKPGAGLFSDDYSGSGEKQDYAPKPRHKEVDGIFFTEPEGWTDDKLVTFYKTIKQKAKDEKQYKQEVINGVWDQYNNLQDFTQKADWQSKEVVPMVFMMVEAVKAFIKVSLMKSRQWYDVQPLNKRNHEQVIKAFLIKNILKFWTDNKEFIYELVESIGYGFLAELYIMKLWWDAEEKYTVEPTFTELDGQFKVHSTHDEKELLPLRQKILRRKRLFYGAVNPSKILLDWTGRGKFTIEEIDVDYADLESLIEDGFGIDIRDKLISESQQDLKKATEKRQKEQQAVPPATYRKELKLSEYHGDVWDNETGKIVFRNIRFIIVNEKYVFVKPQPIIYYDGQGPYVIAPCIHVPGSTYHKSLIEPIIGVAKQMSELFNLTLDALYATVMNVYEVNVNHVLNVDDLTNGIGPNTVIQKDTDEKVLEVTQVGKVPGEAFAGIQMLKQMLYENSAISPSMWGLPTTTKRQTKGEVQQQQYATISFFQSMIQDIENNFIAPVLKKVWYRVMQFQNEFSYPKLVDLIGEESARLLENMTPQERYDIINADVEITVFGISELIAKKEQLNDILAFLKIIGRSPDLMAWVNQQNLLVEIMDMLNLDPTVLLRDKPQQPMNAKQPMQQGQAGQANGKVQSPQMQKILQMMAQARNQGQSQSQAGAI